MDNVVKLYIDIDDVILNTGETFIDFYCKKNNINKTFSDLKDYNFRSIDRNIDKKEFFNYIETDDFFNKVKINEDFINFYTNNTDQYVWYFVTQGTTKILDKKRELLFSKLENTDNIYFIGVKDNKDKLSIDMSNGIQVDDYYNNLYTNAKYKILLKNFHETDYNQLLDIREDVYIVNTFKDIIECIEFFKKYNFV